MIVDHIKNLTLYESVNPHIKTVLKYLNEVNLFNLPQGKTEIDGKNVYVLRESYFPKEEKDCYFEGHENYLDIQLVLKGKEAIGYKYKYSNNIEVKEVIVEKDVTKYDVIDYTKVVLTQDLFALVLPDDLHMPKLKLDDSEHVEKIVFKLKVKGE